MRFSVCILRSSAIAALFGLVACSGGSNASSPASAAKGSGNVNVTIKIPAQSPTQSVQRNPKYVSASTTVAEISVNGGAASIFSLTQGSPNCSTTQNGLTCSFTISAPVGSDTFAIGLYDGNLNKLSTASIVQTVTLGTNTINAVTNGVVASLSLSLGASSISILPDDPATIPVTVNAVDADGNIIVGPGSYANAGGNAVTIALSDTDTSGATALSQTSVTGPTSGITLAFDGNTPNNSVKITASATGYTSATSALPVTALFSYTGSSQTYALPSGVTTLTIVADGAEGGGGAPGASVAATTPVASSGETLTLEVGGTANGGTGGFNGGGNSGGDGCNSAGGGASDVREGGSALSNRIVIAGGGGGGGCDNGLGGGSGGNGGEPGGSAGGSISGFFSACTAGGGCLSSATGGGGGTGGGGSGGAGGIGSCNGGAGASGSLGSGGAGGAGGSCTYTGLGGSGGGGGYYGGGGGGGGSSNSNNSGGEGGAGGGGGSSYAEASATNVSYGLAGLANGQVTITY